MTKYDFIKSATSISAKQIKTCVDLLEDGNTIPFIARYRKDKTGNLDEVAVKAIEDNLKEYKNISDRKQTILKTLTELEELTIELENKINDTWDKKKLEDIYAPYKPKRSTRATKALKAGLKPLALKILKIKEKWSLSDEVKKYIDPNKKVRTEQEAVQGACDIIAMFFADDMNVKEKCRILAGSGQISISKRRGVGEEKNKYEEYYDRKEKVKNIPSHRVLAILRGEKEKFLSISLEIDMDTLKDHIYRLYEIEKKYCKELLKDTVEDSLKRLILPSMQNEILGDLKEKADEKAISIFSKNLESLLLSAPLGEKAVLAVDPGIRTGAKVVVLSKYGQYITGDAVYFQNSSETEKNKIKKMIKDHNIEYVALGNGTGDREVRDFIENIFKEENISLPVISVNESGASIYSASKLAQKEFPNLDLTLRGAISIGRRLQDPLSELVKIDPKSIGVGQYQHDVDQNLLKDELDHVVIRCVNKVGVNLNTSGEYLLKYVAGLNMKNAKEIVKKREEDGPYINRKELLKVKGIGAKTFEQCAGFLRIKGKDPIENTGVHPESYYILKKISKKLQIDIKEILINTKSLERIEPVDLYDEKTGRLAVEDILQELKKPGLDPRDEFEDSQFDKGLKTIDDLKDGMVVNGKVTNITGFGAFCDIGVHQDGLIHISQITEKYIKDVNEVLYTGQKVKVKVISVDTERKRISLSMKDI